jgi:hypothetical protein
LLEWFFSQLYQVHISIAWQEHNIAMQFSRFS